MFGMMSIGIQDVGDLENAEAQDSQHIKDGIRKMNINKSRIR